MNEISTVSIDKKHSKTLERLAKLAGVSKKEFIGLSLDYFEKHGINPAEYESPAQEMQRLIKRVDQVIAFIKKQEQDILRPLCESLASTEERIKIYLEVLPTKSDLKNISDKIQLVNSNIHENKSLLSQTKLSQEQCFLVLTQAVDDKNKGLSDKIKNIFNR